MEVRTLYPTIEEISRHKRLLKKYKLTESALMRHQSGQVYSSGIIIKPRGKSCGKPYNIA